MALSVCRYRRYGFVSPLVRCFRSQEALKALDKASEDKIPNLILYNYPSFSGAFAALFAHLFHSRLNLPYLVLPFSSVELFRVEDLCIDGLQNCYFLDFVGPKGFAVELTRRTSCKIVGFDHRKSALLELPLNQISDGSLAFHVNLKKSSSVAVYEHFSSRLSEVGSIKEGDAISLLNYTFQDQVKNVLNILRMEIFAGGVCLILQPLVLESASGVQN